LPEPVFETNLTESRVIARNECALAQFGAEVARLRVRDNRARIVAGAEALSDQRIEAELFGTGNFNDAIHWRAHGNSPDRFGDIVCRDWLDEGRRRPAPKSALEAQSRVWFAWPVRAPDTPQDRDQA
jgi:hypothetical protein